MRPARLAAIGCLALLAAMAHAAGSGWFGLAYDIDAGGWPWAPIVESAKVKVVKPGTAADAAHIHAGDTVLEMQGIKVPGLKGDDLKKLKAELDADHVPGDVWKLKLARPNGEVYDVTLVATPRPASESK